MLGIHYLLVEKFVIILAVNPSKFLLNWLLRACAIAQPSLTLRFAMLTELGTCYPTNKTVTFASCYGRHTVRNHAGKGCKGAYILGRLGSLWAKQQF